MINRITYNITAINLLKRISVYNMSAKYKNYPLLIDYETFKPLSYDVYHRYHRTLKLGINIDDIRIDNACSIGLLFKDKSDLNQRYIFTIKHGVSDVNNSII